MSMCPEQLRKHIVRPVLQDLDRLGIPYSKVAEDLLLMTCAHESKLGTYVRQMNVPEGVGAFGVFQMELNTEMDIFKNYLYNRPDLLTYFVNIAGRISGGGDLLMSNLAYATAMARVHYYRVPKALPKRDDYNYLINLANYAKKYYNTHLGKATADDYLTAYGELVLRNGYN